jgi:hypothetical protein
MKPFTFSFVGCAGALCAAALFGCATLARASGFDGSQDLLCAPSDVAQCDASANCERVSVSDVDLPPFLRIQFGKKRLASLATPERVTQIENIRKVDGLTILQGAENGRAWSIVIDQESGRMSGSIADSDGAFAVFGACTTQ